MPRKTIPPPPADPPMVAKPSAKAAPDKPAKKAKSRARVRQNEKTGKLEGKYPDPDGVTPKQVEQVLREIIEGGYTQAEACARVGVTRYHWWLAKHSDAALRARVKSAYHEMLANSVDDTVGIADDGSRDYTTLDDGRTVPDYDHIQRSKLRCDVRFKRAQLQAPELFAQQQKVEHSGRVAGLAGVLAEVDGANTGIGPSR